MRFQLILERGQKLVRAKDFEKAGEVLGRLLEMCTKALGDHLALDMAPVYFQYGDALLEQVLEATMGSAEEVDHDEAEAEAKASTVQSSSAAASEPVPAATGVDLEQSDIEELLEISWECLEPARIIYEKYSVGASPAAVANRARLASVLCRLGQVQQLSGKAEDGIKDMLEALQIRKALPTPQHRELADVNALLSNAWLTIAGNATDDTAAPKLVVAMKHHVDGFAALVEAICEQLASVGDSAAPLVAAVRGWWATLPASKGLAIAGKAEQSSDESKPSMAVLMDAAAASGALSEEALGGEAGVRKANQVLHTLGAMQERLEEIVEGNEDIARELGKPRASPAKRPREGADAAAAGADAASKRPKDAE